MTARIDNMPYDEDEEDKKKLLENDEINKPIFLGLSKKKLLNKVIFLLINFNEKLIIIF